VKNDAFKLAFMHLDGHIAVPEKAEGLISAVHNFEKSPKRNQPKH
jgi:hypothetical protein